MNLARAAVVRTPTAQWQESEGARSRSAVAVALWASNAHAQRLERLRLVEGRNGDYCALPCVPKGSATSVMSQPTEQQPLTDEVLASVVISTYNRADALSETLLALADQDDVGTPYEVIVVDDGSTDQTQELLSSLETPYELRLVRHTRNRGVSAGRNSGMRVAKGTYLILLSDDLIVPSDFVARHVEAQERLSDSWIVGGFRQLEDVTASPFGRYLDSLERGYERQRKGPRVGADLWEMEWPTARNLCLPREDLERVGLFDERFRLACEDQDLAERAKDVGIRFIYHSGIECLHNDQHADLARYCRLQERGARDTVLYCAKHPERHGRAAIAVVNGPIAAADGLSLSLRKLGKDVLSRRWPVAVLRSTIAAAERAKAPDLLLFPLYRLAIALSIFSGWREGLVDFREHFSSAFRPAA